MVDGIAKARGATHAQVALAWLRGKEAVTSVILGARTLVQLEDNLGAAGLDLTPAEMKQLDEVSAMPELYPYRLLEEQKASRV